MQLTLGRAVITLAIVFFVIVMLGTAASVGFFGTMFEGFFGDMFGDMFGSVAETVQSATTGTGTRPLPTATVRR